MESKAEGQAGVSVRSFFATPIARVEIHDATAINAALRHAITEREKTTPGVEHSNLGGWQSPGDFQEWGGETGLGIIGLAVEVANRFTCDREGRPVNIDWKVGAWANINRAQQGNAFHTHPGAYWSASYYVDDGGIAGNPALGGEFEIKDPRGVAPAMYAPALAFAVPGGRSAGASELIRPHAGLMLVFPSWLSHGVRPYRGNETRISIAINLSL
jgi:uncharacterized protein (TIGR02466 family)